MKINRSDRIVEPGNVRVCIVGHLLGRNPGFVTTQGLVTADLFAESGYDVISVSSKVNRFYRLADMVATIIRHRRDIDVLIVEVYSGLSFLMTDTVSLVSSFLGIPAVAVLHGGSLPEFVVRFPRWTTRVFRRFSELVAPSAYLRNVMKRIGFHSRIIPNVIDLEKYPFNQRSHLKPRLLWMRGFHDIYNPRMAVETFELIRREYPEATMVMAGADKGLEAGIKQLVLDLGLTEHVRFPGFLDDAAKTREFSAADIYLNTNKIDNMPVTVIESCAFGLPVVATEVGGISSLLEDGTNGLLVPADEPVKMANAVIRLMQDPGLVRKLSENGRSLAERSSWAAVKLQWEDLFSEMGLGRLSRVDSSTASFQGGLPT